MKFILIFSLFISSFIVFGQTNQDTIKKKIPNRLVDKKTIALKSINANPTFKYIKLKEPYILRFDSIDFLNYINNIKQFDLNESKTAILVNDTINNSIFLNVIENFAFDCLNGEISVEINNIRNNKSYNEVIIKKLVNYNGCYSSTKYLTKKGRHVVLLQALFWTPVF